MLEDDEEPMPTERCQANAESASSPLEETDILLLSPDEEMEILRSLSSWDPYVLDDAELLTPLFENDSTLLRHKDDVVDTGPDKCHRHRASRDMDNHVKPAHRDTADSVHCQSC